MANAEQESVESMLTNTTSPGGQFVSQQEREGFVNHPHIEVDQTPVTESEGYDIRGMASSILTNGREYGSKIADRSREVAGRVDQSARANPWVLVGTVGVGGLALGYLLGRSLFSSKD